MRVISANRVNMLSCCFIIFTNVLSARLFIGPTRLHDSLLFLLEYTLLIILERIRESLLAIHIAKIGKAMEIQIQIITITITYTFLIL